MNWGHFWFFKTLYSWNQNFYVKNGRNFPPKRKYSSETYEVFTFFCKKSLTFNSIQFTLHAMSCNILFELVGMSFTT